MDPIYVLPVLDPAGPQLPPNWSLSSLQPPPQLLHVPSLFSFPNTHEAGLYVGAMSAAVPGLRYYTFTCARPALLDQ